MEPNQKLPTQPAPAQPAPANQPNLPVTSNTAPSSSSGSKQMWVVLVILAVLIVLAVVGYTYMNGKSKPAEQVPAAVTSTKIDNLQSDLDSIKIEDVEADFAQVDQDLQSL